MPENDSEQMIEAPNTLVEGLGPAETDIKLETTVAEGNQNSGNDPIALSQEAAVEPGLEPQPDAQSQHIESNGDMVEGLGPAETDGKLETTVAEGNQNSGNGPGALSQEATVEPGLEPQHDAQSQHVEGNGDMETVTDKMSRLESDLERQPDEQSHHMESNGDRQPDGLPSESPMPEADLLLRSFSEQEVLHTDGTGAGPPVTDMHEYVGAGRSSHNAGSNKEAEQSNYVGSNNEAEQNNETDQNNDVKSNNDAGSINEAEQRKDVEPINEAEQNNATGSHNQTEPNTEAEQNNDAEPNDSENSLSEATTANNTGPVPSLQLPTHDAGDKGGFETEITELEAQTEFADTHIAQMEQETPIEQDAMAQKKESSSEQHLKPDSHRSSHGDSHRENHINSHRECVGAAATPRDANNVSDISISKASDANGESAAGESVAGDPAPSPVTLQEAGAMNASTRALLVEGEQLLSARRTPSKDAISEEEDELTQLPGSAEAGHGNGDHPPLALQEAAGQSSPPQRPGGVPAIQMAARNGSGSTRSLQSLDNTPRPYARTTTSSGDTAMPNQTPRVAMAGNGHRNNVGPFGRAASRENPHRPLSSSANIHAAARNGDAAAVQKHLDRDATLCNAPDTLSFSPAHFAACYGADAALTLLLQAKATVEAPAAHGWTPLHLAARNGHASIVRTLLEHRASPDTVDARHANALHNACCDGNIEIIEMLLAAQLSEKGTERAAQGWKLINARDSDGWGPLHFVARFNHAETLEKLLLAGADPNLQDVDGWTAAHTSTRNGRNKCVQLLLDHRGDVCCVTRWGETALHIACRKGKAKVAAIIVESAEKQNHLPVLLEIKDSEGHTPKDFSLVQSILNHGKEPGDLPDGSDGTLTSRSKTKGTAVVGQLASKCCVLM